MKRKSYLLVAALLSSAALSLPAAAQQSSFGAQRAKDTSTTTSDAATPPSFDILSCPFDIFKDAYLGAFETAERLAVMALEDEALAACAKRQERVNLVLKQERELRTLLSAAANEDDAVIAQRRARANGQSEARQSDPEAEQTSAAESSVLGTLVGGLLEAAIPAKEDASSETPDAEDTSDTAAIEAAAPALTAPGAGCEQSYMVELSGHQRHGDGKFHWASLRDQMNAEFVVKAGDALPGGWKISSVSREVVLAITPDGEIEQLPVAPSTSPAVIDGNFYFTIAPMHDAVEAPSEAEDANP